MVRTISKENTFHIWTQLRNVVNGSTIQFTDDNGKIVSSVEYTVQDTLDLSNEKGDLIQVSPPNDNYRWVVSKKDGSAIHSIQSFRKVLWLIDAEGVSILTELL